MIKYIMTTRCPRKCEYCISRNVSQLEIVNDNKMVQVFQFLNGMGYRDLMLTGGEPTIAKEFSYKMRLAKQVFKSVHITTQNRAWLNTSVAEELDSITFSRHGETDIPDVHHLKAVYLSILEWEYTPELLEQAYNLGYKGVSIQEDNYGSKGFKQGADAYIRGHQLGLSIRINREGHCINDNTPIIMPDLSVINSFKEYIF